jgi:hypothetical protein
VNRIIAWHSRTYVRWAVAHEPATFAIYPLLSALGPAVVWLAIGLVPALWFLVFTELLTLARLFIGLHRRRNRPRATH